MWIEYITDCKSLEIMPCGQEIGDRAGALKRNGFYKQLPKSVKQRSNSEVPPCIPESCSVDHISDLVQLLEKNPKNLEAVSRFVQDNKEKSVVWESSDYYLQFCDLNGTIYMGQKFMQEAWEQLYLPKETKMQVFGTLEIRQGMQPCVEWIVLVGEDGCIYAYAEEELHLIARSLSEFVKHGKRKVYSSYYYPDSDSEDECMPEDEEMLKIGKRTRDSVNKSANEFENFLNFLST